VEKVAIVEKVELAEVVEQGAIGEIEKRDGHPHEIPAEFVAPQGLNPRFL
jgi:hypothetical protein